MAHSFIQCTYCGKPEDIEVFRLTKSPLVSKMRAEKLCFECAYWKEWLNNREPDTIVINGQLFKMTNSLQQPNLIEARANNLQFIMAVDTHKAFACKELILRGVIPSQFQTILPDEYKFITKAEYTSIYRFQAEMCLSKGCFDRYHCIWYRADIAEPDEPWNTIPQNYKIGSELCPSFVNKDGKCNN